MLGGRYWKSEFTISCVLLYPPSRIWLQRSQCPQGQALLMIRSSPAFTAFGTRGEGSCSLHLQLLCCPSSLMNFYL